MNISRSEQRVLHVLARGGLIRVERSGAKISAVLCLTREGAMLSDCTLPVFARLRRRGLVASTGGGPYRITHAGRLAVRSQTDKRA